MSVKGSLTVSSQIEQVWKSFRSVKWLSILSSVQQATLEELVPPTNLGTTCNIKYKDGNTQKVKLVGISDLDHKVALEVVESSFDYARRVIIQLEAHNNDTIVHVEFQFTSPSQSWSSEQFLSEVKDYFSKEIQENNEAAKDAKYLDPPKLSRELYKYVLDVGVREHPILAELREVTTSHPRARMMSAPDEINFISVLLKAMKAKKTIEIGVFTGYSALATALALPEDGHVVACDVSEEFVSVGKPYFEKAGVTKKIHLKIAPALETLENLLKNGEEGTFDYAYVDGDKPNYVNYYELLLKLVKKGGIIAFDNVLWSGRVIDPNANEPETATFKRLNQLIHQDPRVDVSMLHIADGVSFVYVK
eukprot:TRINITY_DN7265_c0_g5_i1.p1 TRINITY_DN7265_c0_g5~~TRINITY_DN7265_c0_g5_i1.p1  ORF type:complete len:363 (-),score=87.13 TRINITY_DN7265_c0_g5_i1:11-1099(-)